MASGTEVVVAATRGTTWGTAVTPNAANKGFLTRDLTLPTALGDLIFDDSLGGSGFPKGAVRGLAAPTGDIRCFLRYAGLGHQIAMSMGSSSAPSTVDTSGRVHTWNLATTLDGLFDTIAAQKVVSIWEFPSVKYSGFTLTLTADGLAEIVFHTIASSSKVTSGQVTTTLAAVTYISKALLVFGDQIVIRINNKSAAALASGDRIRPNRLVLNYNRPMAGDFIMDGTRLITEPGFTAIAETSIDLEWPVYGTGSSQQGNSLFTAAEGNVAQKMDITMTSPVLAGATTVFHSHVITFPHLEVGAVQAPVNGPAKIPITARLAAVETDTAPSGMSGQLLPFRWVETSTVTTDQIL